jgi:hypothetical protein
LGADQVTIAALPLVIVLGAALMLTVRAGEATETVTDWLAAPPAPVQVSPYVVLDESAAVVCDPLAGRPPVQPPEAAHEVALVADQLKVATPPFATVLGAAFSVTTGAAALTETLADCDAVPPVPVHVSRYVALLFRSPVD